MSPYRIDGPALLSFSGGRSSAFMLWHILEAHGGQLPADVHACFANTGKEREETLRFVHECGSRWGVEIHWIEWKERPRGQAGRKTPAAERYQEVGLNSASRDGEPFRAVIERKKFLPNAVTRFCTAELKIDTMKQFMIARGYRRWTNAIGLRADEVRRIAKQQKRNDEGRERFTTVWPMLKAGVSSRDVWRFWLGRNADPKNLEHPLPQGFDLGLYPYEGNCDGCFLKGREILAYQERERPGYLDWWIKAEARASEIASKRTGAQFVTEYGYAELKADVARSPLLLAVVSPEADDGRPWFTAIVQCADEAAEDANASLIAAAPDLYEACEFVREWLVEPFTPEDLDSPNYNETFRKAGKAVLAALAKARGDQ